MKFPKKNVKLRALQFQKVYPGMDSCPWSLYGDLFMIFKIFFLLIAQSLRKVGRLGSKT